MVTTTCEECMGTGWIPHPTLAYAKADCDECEGYGVIESPDRFERLVGIERSARIRRPYRRARRRAAWLRQRWSERDAQRVGAMVEAQRGVLDDEPRLRAALNTDLVRKLEEVTPLGWRRADLSWCWANAKRALRGQAMLPLPYREHVDLRTSEVGDLFERNTVALLAERTREPR